MKKVLFDTNLVLDIALKRLPHFELASKMFALIDEGEIIGYITATSITDIYYISKREKGHGKTLEFISNLIEVLEILGIEKEVIVKALRTEMKDFEDAVQIAAAELNEIDCIVTRNEKDFIDSPVKVYNPKEFVEKYA